MYLQSRFNIEKTFPNEATMTAQPVRIMTLFHGVDVQIVTFSLCLSSCMLQANVLIDYVQLSDSAFNATMRGSTINPGIHDKRPDKETCPPQCISISRCLDVQNHINRNPNATT